MKIPCCTVCETKYNEDDRCPLLLDCGHGFCKHCLSRMLSSSSSDHSLSCPRCRHVSLVGNSLHLLRKNYTVLAIISSSANRYSTDNDTDDDDDDDDRLTDRESRSCNGLVELGLGFHSLKLVKRLLFSEELGRNRGVEMWLGVVSGIGEGENVVPLESGLEELRRKAMWCRNVCRFHGVVKVDGCLGLVMDECSGSVETEMRSNEGRLTLEQILRYGANIARGVAELHAASLVCMNLKPSNLLLDENGHAVVSDYGLPAILKNPACERARLESDSSRTHLCMDCTTLNPNYTAPEVWEPVKKPLNIFWDDALGISLESDAWSFGCTLVEMCTGSVLWVGLNTDEIYQAVVKAKRQPPQYASVVGVGIPRDLWKMIGDCLQFKASKRPSFSAMLAIFLQQLQEIPREPLASPYM
ncbi:putative protein kinase TKL-Pl-1 family transcription factor C2H2 family [Helianthus annuus]|nr:putative protein kinase TKL-Pl-1 family transcription factor C2H2 family [Helianthus annuus]